MATRKASSSGPVYGMVPFAGSRQPQGPSPRALELLQEAELRDTSPPAPEPVAAPGPELVPAPTAVTTTATESKPAPVAPSRADEPARAPRRAPATSRRPKPPTVDNYALPPPGAGKPKTRSNHFRLPADVEERLTDLATTHGCSRTRVVCSAITSEWQRLHRRKTRAARGDQK